MDFSTVALPEEKKRAGFANLLLHLHPRVVPEDALRLRRTFGLGGMSLACFLILAATGILLLFGYEPTPERAYASVRRLGGEVAFGAFVRSIHYWAGNAFLVLAALHLLRVFYTGAHLPPRRGNWLLGLALLSLVAASAFTGYLLPWDQLAFWAITVSTGMLQYVPVIGQELVRAARGGAEVGAGTLTLFFVLHAAVLPIVFLFLASFHFWLVRKSGGVILPRTGGKADWHKVPASPHLTVREGVAALVLAATLLVLAAVVEAPLQAPANPGMSPAAAKAPWFFAGVQELLVHFHPVFAVLVLPLLAAVALVALPYLGRGKAPAGRYLFSTRGARSALFAGAVALAVTPLVVVVDERLRHPPSWMPGVPPVVRSGFLQLGLAGALMAALYVFIRKRWGATRLETAQALFTFAVTAFLILTVTGAFFRGRGMNLMWPWRISGGP